MTEEENSNDVYRKLVYFFENKIKIHFKDKEHVFYNGIIISLNQPQASMVFDERVKGVMPILLETINPHSIRQYEEEGFGL